MSPRAMAASILTRTVSGTTASHIAGVGSEGTEASTTPGVPPGSSACADAQGTSRQSTTSSTQRLRERMGPDAT